MDSLICAEPSILNTGVNYHEAKTMIQDFCTSKASFVAEMEDDDQIAHFKTSSGNAKLTLSISYSDCDTDLGAVISIDQSACERSFYRLLDACSVDCAGSLERYGGAVKHGCAVFRIQTEVEEIIRCGENPHARPAELSTIAVEKAIDDYCDQDLVLSPGLMDFNQQFFSETPRGHSSSNFIDGDVVVKTAAQFSGQGQMGCLPSKSFATKGEECRRKLNAIKDHCGGKGGGLSDSSANGCVLWTLWGQQIG